MTTTGQVRHAFPAYKVYIFGLDVSEDVINVEVSYNTGRAPNTCRVTLTDQLDKYTITTADITVLLGPKVKEAAQQKLEQASMYESWDRIIDNEILAAAQTIEPETKRRVILNKITQKIDNVKQPDIAGQPGTSVKTLTSTAYRYPFQAEDPIFHANDPIRVFFRDPYNPKKWYHMFCGFLSNFDDNVDENSVKTLTIGAEGPSKILRYARITTNPGIIDAAAIAVAEQDAVVRSFYQQGFKNLTLPEVLFAIIFGNDVDGKYGGKFTIFGTDANGHDLAAQLRLRGVGNFNFSRSASLEFGPEDPNAVPTSVPSAKVKNLAQYQSIIDHEVKINDIMDMMVENAPNNRKQEAQTYLDLIPHFSDNTPDITKVIDFIGENTDIYPVDGGALIILTPTCFHQSINRNVLTKDIIQSVAMITAFKSRLGMIYDIIDRIEFVFYESPKGDLICELPLYDFDPDDFGNEQVASTSINVASGLMASRRSEANFVGPIASNTPKSNADSADLIDDPSITRGPFGPPWRVNKENIYNYSKGITDEKVRTQLLCPWYPAQNYDENVGSTVAFEKPSVVTLRHLVPLYWLRNEQCNPKGYIATKQAAYVYAHLTLNKMNADAKNLGINAAPNLGFWLNRPIFCVPKNCYATTTGITHSVKWGMGGTMDTRLNANFIRGWDGLLDTDNKPVYTTIGGFPSRPFNYSVLFKLKEKVPAGAVAMAGKSKGTKQKTK